MPIDESIRQSVLNAVPSLRAFAISLCGNVDRADDLVQETLLRALALAPDHLSLYALSLEQGTPMRSWVTAGLLPTPDSDLAADMYLWASDTLAAHGYRQYEISNWAKTKDEGGRRKQRGRWRAWRSQNIGNTFGSGHG